MSHKENEQRKENLRLKVKTIANRAAVLATPVVFVATAHAEETNAIEMGTLGLVGLSAGAATVFAIKAGPSLMMWGYRKILGFIGR